MWTMRRVPGISSPWLELTGQSTGQLRATADHWTQSRKENDSMLIPNGNISAVSIHSRVSVISVNCVSFAYPASVPLWS